MVYGDLNCDIDQTNNILVGNNGAGKTTFLEAIYLALTGRFRGEFLDKVLSPALFNSSARHAYTAELAKKTLGTKTACLPGISIEVYFEEQDDLMHFAGINNSSRISTPGIRLTVEFNEQFSDDYIKRLTNMKDQKLGEEYPPITDIPTEYYRVSRYYFNGDPVIQRTNPFKVFYVDGTRKDYSSYVGKYIYSNISQSIDEHSSVQIQSVYESIRQMLRSHKVLKQFNATHKHDLTVGENTVEFSVKDSLPNEWLNELTIQVTNVPFENIGFGAQKMIQMELAVQQFEDRDGILLFEEPENTLSFTNMSRLVSAIENNTTKQKFISTHSSFVANKLGLTNLLLCEKGAVSSFSELPDEDISYFKKLPGYNTLRLLLGSKTVLVEGPTDELIFEKAFLTTTGVLPISRGIDVLVVDSLAFKRHLDIAKAVHKHVWVITDNDGDVDNLRDRYSDYIEDPLFTFRYESRNDLHTIEPSFLEANTNLESVRAIIHPESWRPKLTESSDLKDCLLRYMTNNKSDWALKVFDSTEPIFFPKYIMDVVNDVNQ